LNKKIHKIIQALTYPVNISVQAKKIEKLIAVHPFEANISTHNQDLSIVSRTTLSIIVCIEACW
jgi:hypothetical protein